MTDVKKLKILSKKKRNKIKEKKNIQLDISMYKYTIQYLKPCFIDFDETEKGQDCVRNDH